MAKGFSGYLQNSFNILKHTDYLKETEISFFSYLTSILKKICYINLLHFFFHPAKDFFSHLNFNGAIFHAIHSVTLKVCFYEFYVAGEFQDVFSIKKKVSFTCKPDYIPCELSCSRTAIFMLLLLCFFFISVYVDKNFSIHMPFNICQKYYL